MPFRLKNAPATFQRALDILLSGVRFQICLIYLDDDVVFSNDHESHLDHHDIVLSSLKETGVSRKLKKCFFFLPRVDFLGHVIQPEKLSVATDRASAFRPFKFPKTLTQLRSFIATCNVYRRFVKNFSKISRPLSGMLCKDAERDFEKPSEVQLASFEILKEKLVTPPILALLKLGKLYLLKTDSSAYQVGYSVLHLQDDDSWRPIGLRSKSLNRAERNYCVTERECYAIVCSMQQLRPYLEGVYFTVRTDHDLLRWILNLINSISRLARWRMLLSEFGYEVEYIPGPVNSVLDAMSRRLTPVEEQTLLDTDVPVFDVYQAYTSSCTHARILVTTRAQAQAGK